METTVRIPESASDILSVFCIAIRFGINSPNTMLKYAITSVIKNTQIEFNAFSGIETPDFTSTATSGAAKLSAA